MAHVMSGERVSGEHLQVVGTAGVVRVKGSAGLLSQVPGQVSTVSGLAASSGGIGRGRMVERDRK